MRIILFLECRGRPMYLIRGKGPCFAKDLVTRTCGFIEGVHHEMQVVGQRAHAGDFDFIGT